LPLVSRTRATFRNAEFGFLGVCVRTIRHTPRFCGEPLMSETRLRPLDLALGFRTNWLIVGISQISNQNIHKLIDAKRFLDLRLGLGLGLFFLPDAQQFLGQRRFDQVLDFQFQMRLERRPGRDQVA